ncbi:Glycine/D-amino acid oxidase (deaminating) [Halalkaliarchaeum sp. AArc-CO]|uniref:NAD(P)/FAD-dependent oxidoreductase n=1 Tax=unclassified Halalkaliarchaeum TaxID=2678344 RepID=UPI00217DC508|nr:MULTISPECIES: FAD-dependent oxidoreductase [unclassified Halalkaliarchaeum]MDR5672204.1 FAD-dependent oxidoreductase [Halalkaliarchaeum sp. AArc-GB]UWG51711.1 Glycine/D-amino acid oxidase (deaminating) [Halalkaliarchaeum sp. AArc-CO]
MSTDVVVIGGGISGAAAAYYLSKREEIGDVTLLEQGENLGNGSTPRAVGGVRSMYSTPVHVELSLASRPVWREFESELGFEIDYRENGYLFGVRSRTQYESLRKDVIMQNRLGAGTEFLTPEEATEIVPGLETDTYVAAAWSPKDAMMDAHSALQAYGTLARENGVDIRVESRVTDLLQGANGRVTGVEVNGGKDEGGTELEADYVINAAGSWGHRIAAMAGVEIPISPKKRRAAFFEPERTVPEDLPLVMDLESGAYFRPEDEQFVTGGGHFHPDDPDVDPDEPSSFSDSVDLEWATDAMDALVEMADYFGPETRVAEGWSGVYAISPSNHPIIEESVPGLVNDIAHSGRAFMHAPATGQIVADLVADGETDIVDRTALQTDGAVDRRGQLPIPYQADMYE